MKSAILSENPRNSIRNFLDLCLKNGLDARRIYSIASTTITHLSGSKIQRRRTQLNQELENRWYASLVSGAPDYSVYDTELYLGELWACWAVYSRKYLLSIQSDKSLFGTSIADDIGDATRIIDLGCGFGYTTAALKELYCNAAVMGTNLPDTMQTLLANQLGDRYGFHIVPNVENCPNHIDIVFASEYFEHIDKPVQHLHEVIDSLSPRVLLIANAFGARAVGHFDEYSVNGRMLDGRSTSKIFNLELKRRGYAKIKTCLWNNRPAYWKRADS